MKKDIIKNTMEELNPTEEQSQKMWERLAQAVEEKNKIENANGNTKEAVNKPVKARFGIKFKIRPFMTVAAVVAIMILTLVGGNIATEGKIYAKIMEWLNLEQGRQDIVGNMVDSTNRNNTVYAPKVCYMDEEILVFGGLRGIVVYSLQQDAIIGTIDTQKVDSVYFDSYEKNTCILKEKNEIIIFNCESDKAVGSYYAFDLTECKGQALEVARSGNEEELLKSYYKLWMAQEVNYVDTFDYFIDMEEITERLTGNENKWSAESYIWEDNTSFLLIENNVFILVSYNVKKDIFHYRTIHMTMDASKEKEQENTSLHQFVYIGENDAIRAIYKYMESEYLEISDASEAVYIPGYIIYKEVWDGDEYLVFGNFYSYGYMLTGNVLEANMGSEMPACFHLKKSNSGYEVVSVDVAQDGSYLEDIEEFTKDYPEVRDAFLEYDAKKVTQARREYLQMYVTEHNLDIVYFKDCGWDPIPIFEGESQ